MAYGSDYKTQPPAQVVTASCLTAFEIHNVIAGHTGGPNKGPIGELAHEWWTAWCRTNGKAWAKSDQEEKLKKACRMVGGAAGVLEGNHKGEMLTRQQIAAQLGWA